MFEYPVELKKDTNGTYQASFPDVPEAHTFGDSRDEALEHAIEALEVALSFYVDEGKELPKSSAKRGRSVVRPSLIAEMKLGIYQSMRNAKVRKTDLARRMGVALMQVDRLLDLTHSSRVEQLEAAYGALGKRVHVELEAA
jgi:antitoxin HicB